MWKDLCSGCFGKINVCWDCIITDKVLGTLKWCKVFLNDIHKEKGHDMNTHVMQWQEPLDRNNEKDQNIDCQHHLHLNIVKNNHQWPWMIVFSSAISLFHLLTCIMPDTQPFQHFCCQQWGNIFNWRMFRHWCIDEWGGACFWGCFVLIVVYPIH